jgi:hypothetical protein
MAFIPGVNIAQVSMQFVKDGQPCENVYHVHTEDASWTPTTLLALADAFDTWDNTSVKNLRANDSSLMQIVVRDLTTEFSPSVEKILTTPRPGTGAGNPMPNGVSLAISWRTGLSGRSFRGRTYHLGMSDTGFVSASVISASRASTFANAYAQLITAVIAANGAWLLVVASRMSGNAHRAAILPTTILTVSVDVNTDSMRRRLPGHNRHR